MEVGLQSHLSPYKSHDILEFAFHLLLTSVRKHVLSDLQPYLCTFEGCSTQMFQSRREWFQHESDKHRKEWHCCLCANELPFSSAGQLEGHLHRKHSEYSEEQISALLSLCGRPPETIPLSACPFCAGNSSSPISPITSFGMASSSLNKKIWNPYRVLDVYPNDPNFTCVGLSKTTQLRCRWSLYSEQFNRDNAVKCLESMSEMHPSEITSAALYSLAQATLCRDFHQRQADVINTNYRAKLDGFLQKHSQLPAAKDGDESEHGIRETLRALESVKNDFKASRPLWSTSRESNDEHEGNQAPNHPDVVLLKQELVESHAKAKALDEQKEKIKAPTVILSSLQFERHVASHLERLALFALPPPVKDSSEASSNQAAASHHSGFTARSYDVSDLSSLSSALPDHESTPELYAAAMSGDIERVKQETRNGADITLQFGRFGNVLQAAAASLAWPIRDIVLEFLLDNGADANVQGGEYGSALQAVAANPGVPGYRISALRLLLDRGAEVNGSGGRYGHALVAAAAMPTPPSPTQHEPTSMVLSVLLDYGANPDVQGPKLYGSALHQAIEHSDYESVKLLLDRGASATIHHEDCGIPVHHAMKVAYEPVWDLLREAAVETNLERHYDRVRLDSALRIQRHFRDRQKSGARTVSIFPQYLRQSQHAVRAKFIDLAGKDKVRILQGRNDPSSPWIQDTSPHVMKRNRYRDVQPWDKSRIHLNVAEGKSDYINASPISLRDPRTGVETRWIATQGPKMSTGSHFWHMIWQETNDVAVVVMLTQTHDGTIEKCSQYFPLNVEAGSFIVQSLDIADDTPEGNVTFLECHMDVDSKAEIRKLSLSFGAETKIIWHFLFCGWPDFAVPEDSDLTALLNLLKICVEKNTSSSSPMVIHDSAGVGRTGTFIALQYLLVQVESGAILDVKHGDGDMIYDVVNRLREQRMLMVQMESQYQFLYRVIRGQLRERHLSLGDMPKSEAEIDPDSNSEPDMPSEAVIDSDGNSEPDMPKEAENNFDIGSEPDRQRRHVLNIGRENEARLNDWVVEAQRYFSLAEKNTVVRYQP